MTGHQERTRLHGRWLIVARLGWVAFALLYTGVFLATLPEKISQPVSGSSTFNWTEEEFDAALAEAGWSRRPIHLFNQAVDLVLFGVNLLLAWFIFWRRSDDWMALWVAATFAWFTGSGSFDFLADRHPAWAFVGLFSDSLGTALIIILFFLFPDGRFVPRWTRGASLGVAVLMAWRLYNEAAYEAVAPVFFMPLLLMMGIAQVYRYRRIASPGQRQQIKWVVFGLVGGLAPLILYYIFALSFPELNRPDAAGLWFNLLGLLLWIGFAILLLASFTLAILRSRLWDIDVLIRKTLVWGALTALLGLVYFGGVTLLQSIFSVISGQQSAISIVISTLAIAALFNPLRTRVQEFVDRRFYRRKYDAEQALASFAALARQEVDLEEISARLLEVVEETVQPQNVSLWLRPTPGDRTRIDGRAKFNFHPPWNEGQRNAESAARGGQR